MAETQLGTKLTGLKEIAKYLGRSTRTVQRLIASPPVGSLAVPIRYNAADGYYAWTGLLDVWIASTDVPAHVQLELDRLRREVAGKRRKGRPVRVAAAQVEKPHVGATAVQGNLFGEEL